MPKILLVILGTAVLSLASTMNGQEGGPPPSDEDTAKPAATGFGSADTVGGAFFGKDNAWDSTYEKWADWKKSHWLPITVGAHNWFHINNDGPNASGYGIPGLQSTYRWFVDADPRFQLDSPYISALGAHSEFRFRESDEKFRGYFPQTYYFYESYLYVETPIGKIKGGQIWRRFGLDWDGTWWGNVQYFNGFKLNPDYGFSWENTWNVSKNFKVDSFAQYFITEDGVSGALAGADPESVVGSQERNTGVVRVVPTWKLSEKSSLALGISGMAGEIRNKPFVGPSTTQIAWAVDLTFTYARFSMFGEIAQHYGVLNQNNYVSGGPSDRITDTLVGASYKYGPATFRASLSNSFMSHPSGNQLLFVPGVTLALTRNVDLYVEYVHWDVTNRFHQRSDFENGVQIVFVWQL